MYAIARLLSKTIPAIGSISFHLYVYLILMTAVLNVLNVIPVKLKVGVKQCSDFLTKPLMCYCMVGIGIAFTDLGELAAALTWQTLVISAAVVAGSAIGAGFVGKLFGFNFVESGVTAGLCMANRGGSGKSGRLPCDEYLKTHDLSIGRKIVGLLYTMVNGGVSATGYSPYFSGVR